MSPASVSFTSPPYPSGIQFPAVRVPTGDSPYLRMSWVPRSAAPKLSRGMLSVASTLASAVSPIGRVSANRSIDSSEASTRLWACEAGRQAGRHEGRSAG
eukprot:scaffold18750_cov113-Isochrysis_galbana.AAC.3